MGPINRSRLVEVMKGLDMFPEPAKAERAAQASVSRLAVGQIGQGQGPILVDDHRRIIFVVERELGQLPLGDGSKSDSLVAVAGQPRAGLDRILTASRIGVQAHLGRKVLGPLQPEVEGAVAVLETADGGAQEDRRVAEHRHQPRSEAVAAVVVGRQRLDIRIATRDSHQEGVQFRGPHLGRNSVAGGALQPETQEVLPVGLLWVGVSQLPPVVRAGGERRLGGDRPGDDGRDRKNEQTQMTHVTLPLSV